MELYSLRPGESIELRAIAVEGDRRYRDFVGSWEELDERAIQLDLDYNVYFGVAPRIPDASGKLAGGNANVSRIPVLWLDADAKGPYSKADRYAQLAPWAPTWIVDSGGGLHAYWRLSEDAEPQRAQRFLKGLARQLDCDDTSDPARILRVPGTRNHKRQPPVFVDVVQNSGPTHSMFDLESRLVIPLENAAVTTHHDHGKRVSLLEKYGKAEGPEDIEDEHFDGRDAAMFEAACFWRDHNHDQREVIQFCKALNQNFRPPLSEIDVERKVSSAFTREAPPVIVDVIEAAPLAVQQPPRAQIMSVKEILSFEEPPIEFLARGMFARSSIEFIAHPPKSGKTTVGINWGLRMAAGMSGAGLLDVAKPYRVLLWQPNADMSPRRTREWIRRIIGGLGLPDDVGFDFWSDDGNTQIGENIKMLEERCAEYDIVMIDSLNRFLPGVDEVDTRVVAESFNVVRRLRTVYPEVCWVYIVQVGKNSAQHLGSLNPSFALRGNSAVAEAYDTMIQLSTPKNTERDPEKGLALNRHILFHGRDADAYRGPFRTRYNLDTHVLEWECDLTPEQALGESSDTDRESQRHLRDDAVDLLKIIFNDAEEETGERKVRASEVYEVGLAHGLSKKVMGSAFKSMGGTHEGQGKNSVWVDFQVEVVE